MEGGLEKMKGCERRYLERGGEGDGETEIAKYGLNRKWTSYLVKALVKANEKGKGLSRNGLQPNG